MRMKNLLKDKVFMTAFATTICLFIVLNILVYLMLLYDFYYKTNERFTSTITIHLIFNVGLPFPMYFWTDYSHEGRFIWQGIVGNIISITIFSFIIGLIVRLIWSKISASKLR